LAIPAVKNFCRLIFLPRSNFSPSSASHAEAMEKDGYMRNFEATLRRKDGSPIYVLINAFGMYDNLGRCCRFAPECSISPAFTPIKSNAARARLLRQDLSTRRASFWSPTTAGSSAMPTAAGTKPGSSSVQLLGRPVLELAAPAHPSLAMRSRPSFA